jgi:1-acyl-sn-glycerol-3-phosphate acyltransferase
MNTFIYDLSKLLGCIFAHLFFRVRKIGFGNLPAGPYLLVCNHISHFDPPMVVLAASRRLEFMTWHKLFASKWAAAWLRAVGCFSLNVTRPDVRSVREAIRRLRASSIVFPEGGIRTGLSSVLEGHPLPLGAAGLASLGHCPVRACVVIGTDQLYDWHKWFQRPEIYIVCGREFVLDPILFKHEARQKLTRELQAEFQSLYHRTFKEHRLSNEIIPRTAQERWATAEKPSSANLGKIA